MQICCRIRDELRCHAAAGKCTGVVTITVVVVDFSGKSMSGIGSRGGRSMRKKRYKTKKRNTTDSDDETDEYKSKKNVPQTVAEFRQAIIDEAKTDSGKKKTLKENTMGSKTAKVSECI